MADAKADAKQESLRGTLPAGTRLRNYELISVLGQGGFGITYCARDVTLGREVAVKEYLPTSLALREQTMVMPRSTQLAEDFIWGRERFLEEARTLATLEHAPAVVRVYDFLEANGTAYMVMALAKGETLEERLNREGKLPAVVVGRLFARLLDGLEAVHKTGFLHRDVKPGNIILDAKNNPTLIDFGASRASIANRTTAMTTIFTPRYAAAEQLTSDRQGPWTDIYSVSATFYHAISGKPPPSSLERALNDAYEPLVRLEPQGYSPNLLFGIDAGLAVRPRERPQSIKEWRQLLAGRETSAADTTVFIRPTPGPSTVILKAPMQAPGAQLPASRPPAPEHRPEQANAPAPPPAPAPAQPSPPTSRAQSAAALVASTAKPMAASLKSLATAPRPLRPYLVAGAIVLILMAAAYAIHSWTASPPVPSRAASTETTVTDASPPNQAETAQKDDTAAKAKADAQAREQAALDAKQKSDAEARQKADDEARQQAELEAMQKAEAAAKVKAEADAKAKAEADDKAIADAAAKTKVDANAKQKAEADAAAQKAADAATQKATGGAAEAALNLSLADRTRLQVALTSLGFDTHGADGVLGPRSREMIQNWQQARQRPATGFLTATDQQALLGEAAPALAKYDGDRRKAAGAAAQTTPPASLSRPAGNGVSCQDSSGRRLDFPNGTSCPYGLTQVR